MNPVTPTLLNTKIVSPAPQDSCKEDKQLTFYGIIPDELEPIVAVGAGVAITGLGLPACGSDLSSWLAKLVIFFQGAVGQVIQGRHSEDEKKTRAFRAVETKEIALGLIGRKWA
ncbi:MAG: hypothetical protein WCF90_06845 [Methanomicrobiales archaeon]